MTSKQLFDWYWEHRELTLPLTFGVVARVLNMLKSKWPNGVGAIVSILPDLEQFMFHIGEARKPKGQLSPAKPENEARKDLH